MSFLRRFLAMEAAGGIVLMAAATLAMILANSPLAPDYAALVDLPIGLRAGGHDLSAPLRFWIDDGLMTLFFLLVGLELKREVLEGRLSHRRHLLLPGIAAAGGMIVPALIFAVLARGSSGALRGWAIPTATDIAFALGVLGLFGRRIPPALKVFLAALAILDDLGAIVIIACFYTAHLVLPALIGAALLIILLVALNRAGVRHLAPYLAVGLLLWASVLASGVHPTLAGVALAMTIPLGNGGDTPLRRLEAGLHGPVAFLIVPLFGLVNAGIAFAGVGRALLTDPVTLGIAAGLCFGKPIGIAGAAWGAIRLKHATLPKDATWRQFCGVALLCGIGFTMSLFIGALAFADDGRAVTVKLGVIGGSLLSALAGSLWLGTAAKTPERDHHA